MNTIKHLFTALLLLCATVATAHDFEVDGIYYDILSEEDKTVAVTYRGSYYNSYDNEYTGSVVIPESVTYNGTTYSVTSIGEIAFRGCTGLTSITIPNNVTSIGNYAFLGCTGLTSITIPNSVTSIGHNAFSGCNGLTSVEIGNSVTSIGNHAFDGCKGLTSITIPNSVTSIGSYAFYNCTGLTSIVIGNSVTSIESDAFAYCTGLTSIVIPNSVTSIESYAFAGCSGLTSITIPNSVTSIGNYALYGCSGLTSIEIPNSVTSIRDRAFCGCSGLTSIEIPNSATSIGNDAFYGCTGLKTVFNFSNLTFRKGSNSYGHVAYYADKVYNAPNGSKEGDFIFGKPNDVNTLLYYLGNATELTLPANYKGGNYTIGANVFKGNTTITSITIPNSITSIGDDAFYNCSGLTSITIPNSVTSIGNYALYGCSGLTSIEIPNSVTSIGNHAFDGCKGLTSVVIPNSVTSIGMQAFYYCSGLTSIVIPNSVTSIGDKAFDGCKGLKTVVNLSNLTFSKGSNNNGYVAYYADKVYNAPNASIEGDYVFGKPTGVNTLVCYLGNAIILTLPADYKGENYVIGNEAFKNNEALTGVTVPDGVTSIGKEAFYGCTSLNDLKIGKRIVSIDEYAFYGCSSLENLKIGDGVKSIEKYAFHGCENLKNIVLGKRVNYIGDYAFATSYKIETIYALPTRAINCENTATAFHQNAYKYATLYVKESSIDSYETAEPWSKFYIEPIGDFTLTYMIDGEVYKKEKYEYDSAVTPLDMPEKEGHTFSGWSEIPETMPAYDVTVTGYYNINRYNLTYMIDGEEYYTTTVEYGAVVPEIENPSREGHTFGGWSEVPTTMPAEDVVIEGSFAVNSYNVIYIVDGEEYKRESFAYGTIIALPEEPTKEGHTFSGWSDMPETMPAHDIIVTGSYTINSYNLTYMVDGDVYYTTVVEFGATISEIEAPNKKGYTFSGWDDVPEVMPARDVVIEGSFAANSYYVIYIVDGEEYKRESVVYGTAITLPGEPTKEGHTFSGWSEIPATMPAEDITVTGSFSVNSYNVTFVVDEEVYKTISVNYGETIPMPEEPVKDGCTFSGWSEIPATMPAEDITITGSFYANYYTLTYMVDGEVYATVTVGYNAVIPEMEEPTKEGHTFSGWENVPETMPAQDITIIGSFTVNSYNAIFLVDNALYAMLSVNYGEAIELPEPPSKEGFVFDGWEGLPMTMPAKDIVLIAIFTDVTGVDDVKSEIGKVKAIYDLNGRVVENPTSGIYIIDGKKCWVSESND